VAFRRLLDTLAANGHAVQSDLIRREDFPPQPRYLPRPLSPQEDQWLQQELRRTDDLYANALLLIRTTGIRVGECVHLLLDCLRQMGSEQWALHVPSANCTRNAWFRLMPRCGGSSSASSLCALHPGDSQAHKTSCCRIAMRGTV